MHCPGGWNRPEDLKSRGTSLAPQRPRDQRLQLITSKGSVHKGHPLDAPAERAGVLALGQEEGPALRGISDVEAGLYRS